MDKKLEHIYNNISLMKKSEENYAIKVFNIQNPEQYLYCYYKTEEDFFKDCKKLFVDIIPKKNMLNKEISYSQLYKELKNYLFYKILKENSSLFAKKFIFSEEDTKKISKLIKEIENSFKEYIKKYYPLEINFFYGRIYNISISKKEEIESYTLYKVDKNEDELAQYLNYLKNNCQIIPEYVIKTKIKARDCEAICELANKKNDDFLSILNFMRQTNVTIDGQYNFISKYNISLSENMECEYSNQDFCQQLNFNEIKNQDFFKKLVELIEKDNPNFLEKKIKLSLHWLKEAKYEKAEINALVKAITSLEALILTKKLNEKYGIQNNAITIPLIILEIKEEEKKKKIIKILKELYDKRSEVVHNGEAYVEYNEIQSLLKIIEDLIVKLIEDQQYGKLKTEKRYNEYFTEKILKLKSKSKVTLYLSIVKFKINSMFKSFLFLIYPNN